MVFLFFPPAIIDARKFLKMGVWRSVLLIIPHVEFRLPVLIRAFFQDEPLSGILIGYKRLNTYCQHS
jgi:hypothetical protein